MNLAPTGRATDGGRVDLDELLATLSSERARFVCYYLTAEDVSEVNELFLAREVAAWETGTDPSQVTTEKATVLLEEMREDTLPRLDAVGLVSYDPGRGTVRYGDPPDQVARLVSACRAIEQPA